MPAHTHERRMEVYMYFEVPEDNVVFHMMGEGRETRHIVMQNEQAVISRAGASTRARARATTRSSGRWAAKTRRSTTWT